MLDRATLQPALECDLARGDGEQVKLGAVLRQQVALVGRADPRRRANQSAGAAARVRGELGDPNDVAKLDGLAQLARADWGASGSLIEMSRSVIFSPATRWRICGATFSPVDQLVQPLAVRSSARAPQPRWTFSIGAPLHAHVRAAIEQIDESCWPTLRWLPADERQPDRSHQAFAPC